MAYSVSFPVCIARSQLSNRSTSGHTMHVTRITVANIRDVRDRMQTSIPHDAQNCVRETLDAPIHVFSTPSTADAQKWGVDHLPLSDLRGRPRHGVTD
jgi:hypothetical protein